MRASLRLSRSLSSMWGRASTASPPYLHRSDKNGITGETLLGQNGAGLPFSRDSPHPIFPGAMLHHSPTTVKAAGA